MNMHFKARIQMVTGADNCCKIHIKWLNAKLPDMMVDYEFAKGNKEHSGVVVQMTKRYDGVKYLFTDDKWHYFEATKVTA
jgi:hypothetical protein